MEFFDFHKIVSLQPVPSKHLISMYLHSSTPPPPPTFEWGAGKTLPKTPRTGGWKNCWRVEEFCRKGGNAVSLGIFSSWGVANVTTVTLNYILIIVLLFALNVGVSPCFHRSVLGPVYRMYTSCFHNTVVSSCYRLHTFCLHHASVNSCFSLNMWF